MEALIIKGTEDSPEVNLDFINEIFSFSGKSLPEDVSSFYKPIIDWFIAYSKHPLKKTIVDVKLQYFNTASSKLLLDIFMVLEEMQSNEHAVLINWHYPEYDEEMKDAGIEYSEMVNLEFESIVYE